MTLKNLLDAYLLVPIINLMDANVPVWLPLQSQSSQWDNGSLKLFYGQWTIELANKFIIGACHCSNKQCMLNAHTHRQLSFIVPSSDPTLATLASLQNLRISSGIISSGTSSLHSLIPSTSYWICQPPFTFLLRESFKPRNFFTLQRGVNCYISGHSERRGGHQ